MIKILTIVILLLFTSCSEPGQTEYSKILDAWREVQIERAKAQNIAATANLSVQLIKSQAKASELQAALNNTRAENDRLKTQIKSLPTQQELQTTKQLLGGAMAGEATARMMYELKVKDFEALENDYKSALISKLRWFESIEVFAAWVADNELPVVMVTDNNGVINFNEYQGSPIYDCDDYAEDWAKLAESQGYWLWECPVVDGYVWETKVINLTGNHVGNMTKIGNVYYYAEPNPLMSVGVVEISKAD